MNDLEKNNIEKLTQAISLDTKKHTVVSIIGEPNAGKSTLLNKILGQKLSAVTHKAQTTRNVINGIAIFKQTQIIFLDTPGIFDAKRGVDKFIVKEAWQTIKNADTVIVLLDIMKPLPLEIKRVFEYLKKINKQFIIAINKYDKIEIEFAKNNIQKLHEELDNILNQSNNQNSILDKIDDKSQEDIKNQQDDKKQNQQGDKHFTDQEITKEKQQNNIEIFNISALQGNFENLLEYISKAAPHLEWMHDEDEITTLPLKFLAQEITREKIMLYAHDEIPYNVIVETERFEQKKDECKIYQVIKVISQSHKKIILGKNGEKIKIIGQKARLELEQIYGYKIHLFLYIQVRPNFIKHDNAFGIRV